MGPARRPSKPVIKPIRPEPARTGSALGAAARGPARLLAAGLRAVTRPVASLLGGLAGVLLRPLLVVVRVLAGALLLPLRALARPLRAAARALALPVCVAVGALTRLLRAGLRRARLPLTALAAAALVVPLTTSVPAQAEEEQLLQGVQVRLGKDGSITAVEGTAVVATPGSSSTRATSSDYEPASVADDLPVRIRTSYRTEEGVGTDLAELAGYTGLVTIDVTVENLTVEPQSLTYDVAGEARTQTALVGAPLTLVASSDLSVAPDRVVTASQDPEQTTNGVLSQGADGSVQVQWGVLLAPPQLGATTSLRLVVDAEDFEVPEIDMSVQPGIVTDPSLQGLLDSAFRTDSASQLALTASTIDVLGQVNDSLVRSNDIMARVSTGLSTNAEAFASRTLPDLAASSQTLTTSMRSTSSQLDSLAASLAQSLNGAESSTVSQLQQVVATARAVLGDTSQPAAVPQVSPGSCSAPGQEPAQPDSTAPSEEQSGDAEGADGPGASGTTSTSGTATTATSASGGLYGAVTSVTGQLQALASSTEECKQAVQEQLLATVGPASPDAETCQGQESATCQLLASQEAVADSTQVLRQEGQRILSGMQPELATSTAQSATSLGEQVDQVRQAASRVGSLGSGIDSGVTTLEAASGSLSTQLDAVTSWFSSIHTQLEGASASNTSATSRIQDLASQMCTLLPDAGQPDQPGQPDQQGDADGADGAGGGPDGDDPDGADGQGGQDGQDQAGQGGQQGDQADEQRAAEVESVRAYLTTTPCPDNPWAPQTLPRPDGQEATVSEELAAQDKALSTALELSDTSEATETGRALSELSDSVTAVTQAVAALRSAVSENQDGQDGGQQDGGAGQGGASITEAVTALDQAVTSLEGSYADLSQKVEELRKEQESMRDQVATAFDDAATATDSAVSDTVQTQIRLVATQAQVDAQNVGAMFDAARDSMSAQAQSAAAQGAQAVDAQNAQLESTVSQASQDVRDQVQVSLVSTAGALGRSVVDIEAARALLSADLNRVLLDLGGTGGRGTGIIGMMGTSAALVSTASYQVALAQQTNATHASLRSRDMAGILLQQAQVAASQQALEDLPAFNVSTTVSTRSTTLYSFHLGDA